MKDVLIAGGGPAGSALAVQLGRRGLTVDLMDRSVFPREKACGEGILPPGVEVLKSMGLTHSLGGQRLSGVRYHVGHSTARAGFGVDAEGEERFGLGQRRQVLDNFLWTTAAETPGVQIHEGVAVERALVEGGRVVGVLANGVEHRAGWVVGADGSASALRRSLKLERVENPKRVGVRVHFKSLSADVQVTDIQVFLRDGYELYITPLPERQMLVAALASQQRATRIRHNFWLWCAKEPLLRGWLRGAEQSSSLLGQSALRRSLARASLPSRLTFIGDAAASSDPITAGGISLALKDAQLLAEKLPEMICGNVFAERHFARAQRAAQRTHRMLGGGLLLLSERPRMAERACQMLSAFPPAMSALLGMAAR